MLEQAITLTLIGVGTVFFFLILMVFVMHGTAAILKNRFPDPPVQSKSKPTQSNRTDKVKIAIAIAAAKRNQS